MGTGTVNNPTIIPLVISCTSGRVPFAAGKTEIVVKIIVVVVNIVTSVLGTLANGIVMTAYYRNRRLKTIQNTIFLLLAATDISITAVVQPIYVVATLRGLMEKRDCLVWEIVTVSSWLFLGLSMATINILSWQSYITLAYPYRSQVIITKHRLKIAVVLTWFLTTAAVLKSTFLHYMSFASYLGAGVIFLTMISVFFTWVSTYRIVARQRRVIQANQTPATQKFVARKKLRILRSTITALLVTTGLFACYTPGFLLAFYTISSWDIEHKILLLLQLGSSLFMYLSSFLNPCLVFWRSSGFRQAARNILFRKQT